MMSDEKLLGRIDERTQLIQKDVESLRTDLRGLHRTFVTKHEFKPVALAVHGLVAAILLAFIGALIALVVR